MMGEGIGMGIGGGFMWLFWILLILGIVWAVKAVAGIGNSPEKQYQVCTGYPEGTLCKG